MLSLLRRLASSLLVISLLALALRVAFLVHQARLIPADVLATVPFENEVGNIAYSLVQGHGFGDLFRQPTGPTAWLAPVYPLFVAAIFKFFGAFTLLSFYAAALLNCVFSAAATVPVYLAARRISGCSAAVAAAWIWAIFPSGIMMPFEWIWDTSLSALLAALLLWATLRLADSPSRREALAYGLLWGFALLTNPALGSLFPFFLFWIVLRQQRNNQFRLSPLLLVVTLAAALCLPWTVRNAIQFQRLIPLRSNFSFELWLGNNEIFDPHSRAVNRITRFEQVRRYSQLGESAFVDEKWQKAAEFISTHQALTARLIGRRVLATWIGTETPRQDFVHADSLLVRIVILWNGLTILALAVALVRLLCGRSPYLIPLLICPLVFPIVYYVTHTSLRYRHPLDPILAIFIAVALPFTGLPVIRSRQTRGEA